MTIVKNIKGYKTEIVIGTHMDFVDLHQTSGKDVDNKQFISLTREAFERMIELYEKSQ